MKKLAVRNGNTPKPSKKRSEKKSVPDSAHTKALKDEFGSKCEFFRERIEQNSTITSDVQMMKDLVNIFGLKKFYDMEVDADWAKRIKRLGSRFQCADCKKEYSTELGLKYHVKGKCPKNIAKYRCFICSETQFEASRLECKYLLV